MRKWKNFREKFGLGECACVKVRVRQVRPSSRFLCAFSCYWPSFAAAAAAAATTTRHVCLRSASFPVSTFTVCRLPRLFSSLVSQSKLPKLTLKFTLTFALVQTQAHKLNSTLAFTFCTFNAHKLSRWLQLISVCLGRVCCYCCAAVVVVVAVFVAAVAIAIAVVTTKQPRQASKAG